MEEMKMGKEFDPNAWSTFFSAQTGATAALVGLIFVAVSINLTKIVEFPHLVARSAKALLTLTGALAMSTVCLVPGQRLSALAGELLALGVPLWLAITLAQRAAVRGNTYIGRREKILYPIFAQFSVLPYLVAAASLFVRTGGGLYWLVGGITASYLVALSDAWVLLIEIQR
jgi:modulator of FtsH protease